MRVLNNVFFDPGVSIAQVAFEKGLRRFDGNGATVLQLPGCTAVRQVFSGHNLVLIPPSRIDTYPTDYKNPPTMETVEVPLWKFIGDHPTGPILARSEVANEGIWQEKFPFYIDGDFTDQAEPVKQDKPNKG